MTRGHWLRLLNFKESQAEQGWEEKRNVMGDGLGDITVTKNNMNCEFEYEF